MTDALVPAAKPCRRCGGPTVLRPNGKRLCRACAHAYQQRRYQAVREQVLARLRARRAAQVQDVRLTLPTALHAKATAAARACDLSVTEWIEEAIETQLAICRHGKADSPDESDESDTRLGTCGKCGERFVRSPQYRVFCPTHTMSRPRPALEAAT